MYQGQSLSLQEIQNGLVELSFDLQGESVNKINELMLKELGEAVSILSASANIRGVLISSAKPGFIVGADITEFQSSFNLPADALKSWAKQANEIFCVLENLPVPTVAAINGMALGGGFELALSADFRVLGRKAKVGLPEVNLGICPGWGGTVRLSRLLGLKESLNWLMTGKPCSAEKALSLGAVDRVVDDAALRDAAIALLEQACSGAMDAAVQVAAKHKPLEASLITNDRLQQLRQEFGAKLNPNYPAAGVILESVLQHCGVDFNSALNVEIDAFVSLAKTEQARCLVGLFMNDQQVKKKAKHWSAQATKLNQTAVLGAGIMGGGVAYQSASTGTPILMKDINTEALDLGMRTVTGLLDGNIKKGRMNEQGKAEVIEKIKPTLEYQGFTTVDLVVEAVVENSAIKQAVLAEVEQKVPDHAVVTSNTSTISIDQLCADLQRPEQFCGMHFFNPVHLMPLVEVIRGSKTSDQAISQAVAYANAMGKVPIVVNDCPGFLVNRILFPYFNGFNRLLRDGVDFQRIDRLLEGFGWPMGPAYLADVIGLDTMVHADHVMQDGFPERMGHAQTPILEELLESGYLGQKNKKGFYEYAVDEQGRRYKKPSALASEIMYKQQTNAPVISDQEIIDRMMIPMCIEAVRCLEEGIVETAAEVDMGLILGLGFPRFRGGALRYIDSLGLDVFAAKVKQHAGVSPLYQLPESYFARLQEQKTFY